ncbi:hypothetical protein D9613_006550 [Agrocybe pediades]|uniref:Uncharacterized protein n=1 Tax=Agrocybe pediades TaxID=84607 RepID=A0A8H4VJR6_9AGAR|nr:hypothetical protein D9613_006550 [Agrocybe pediades]
MFVLSGELARNPTRMTVFINTPRFNHATVADANPSVRICETVTPGKSKKEREAKKKKKKKKRMKEQMQKASRETAHDEEPLNHTQSHAIDIAMTKLPSMENM